MSVDIISTLGRKNGANFAVAKGEDVLGAFVTVPDVAARDSIVTGALRPGALIRIGLTNNFYEWSGSSFSLFTGFGSNGHSIEDEGVAVTPRSALNFVGVNVTVADSGGKTVVTIGAVSLTAGVSGILPTANGGTGLSTLGSNGQILTIVGGVPAWATPGGGSLTAPSNPGDNGKVAIAASGNFSYAFIADANVSPTAALALSKLADGTACSVVGRGANSSGAHADIAAGSDGLVLRRSGNVLGFGTIDTAGITDGAVTLAKLASATSLSVLGRASNSAGVYADIAAGTDDHVLRRSGTTIGFGQVATGGIADAAVTYGKIQNVSAASRVLGRGSAAGAGDCQELTCGVGVRVNATAIELSAALAPMATLGTGLQQLRVNSGATALEYFSPPSPVDGGNLTNANATKNISDGSQFTLPASTLATSAKTLTLGTSGTPENDEIIEVIVYAQGFDFILKDGGAIGDNFYTVTAGQKRVLHAQWNASAGAWRPAGKIRLT